MDDDIMSTIEPGSFLGAPRIPGYNVDHIDVDAGMAELAEIGFEGPHRCMVIEYALNLWRRGEEAHADKVATDSSFYGIDYTSWRRVLAAARAAGEAASNS